MKYNVGSIAFMVGFFGAIIVGLLGAFGLFEMNMWLSGILIVAGLLIGSLNAMKDEKVGLMVAALVIGAGAGVLSTLEFVGTYLTAVLEALAFVVVPAGIVIAVLYFMDKGR